MAALLEISKRSLLDSSARQDCKWAGGFIQRDGRAAPASLFT